MTRFGESLLLHVIAKASSSRDCGAFLTSAVAFRNRKVFPIPSLPNLLHTIARHSSRRYETLFFLSFRGNLFPVIATSFPPTHSETLFFSSLECLFSPLCEALFVIASPPSSHHYEPSLFPSLRAFLLLGDCKISFFFVIARPPSSRPCEALLFFIIARPFFFSSLRGPSLLRHCEARSAEAISGFHLAIRYPKCLINHKKRESRFRNP